MTYQQALDILEAVAKLRKKSTYAFRDISVNGQDGIATIETNADDPRTIGKWFEKAGAYVHNTCNAGFRWEADGGLTSYSRVTFRVNEAVD